MASRIHIQHVVLSLEPGGLENGVVNVVNRLDPARFRSSVCCLKTPGEFAARLRGEETGVHAMGWRGGVDPLLPLRLAALFRRTKTDIVHTRNSLALIYGFLGARLAGIGTLVHSEHGRTFDERPLRLRLERALCAQADALFAVSRQLKSDLVERVGIPADRIDVLYNGVDLGRFRPEVNASARAKLGLAEGTLVVGSVGRLVPVKNYRLLLRAVLGLPLDGATLVLVGDGPERDALESMAREKGMGHRVRFLGHREDVAGLLRAMDVFVLPSVSEGMSNTLLEAMAAGIAVVASDVGGNPEIVRDGVDGCLFPSRDEIGLRSRLQELLSDAPLRARYAAAGRARVLQDFSIEAMISRYETLYLSAFSAGARNR